MREKTKSYAAGNTKGDARAIKIPVRLYVCMCERAVRAALSLEIYHLIRPEYKVNKNGRLIAVRFTPRKEFLILVPKWRRCLKLDPSVLTIFNIK